MDTRLYSGIDLHSNNSVVVVCDEKDVVLGALAPIRRIFRASWWSRRTTGIGWWTR